jgi:transcriptional regulator with XRE-family HTH domain
MAITGGQVAAARKLLGWSQETLAAETGVSRATIAKFEQGKQTPPMLDLSVVRRMLSDAGIEFDDEEQAGVRLRKLKWNDDIDPQRGRGKDHLSVWRVFGSVRWIGPEEADAEQRSDVAWQGEREKIIRRWFGHLGTVDTILIAPKPAPPRSKCAPNARLAILRNGRNLAS